MPCRLLAVLFVLLTQTAMSADNPAEYVYAINGKIPDAITGGNWFNCGPTGIRAKITIERPTEFLVQYVFDDSPAAQKVFKDDRIIGANGKVWVQKDTMKNGEHGYEGPRLQLGMAIEDSEGTDGKLSLIIIRKGEQMTVDVRLEPIGRFSATFPYNCKKTEIIIKNATEYLLKDRRWEHTYTHARCITVLGLLAQGNEGFAREYVGKLKLKESYANDDFNKGDWTWDVSLEGIMLSELYLATKDNRILPRLEYLNRWYSGGAVSRGCFCHHFGQSGYGSMTAPTAMVAAAWLLMKRCGVKIDEEAYVRARWCVDVAAQPGGHMSYACPFKEDRPIPQGGYNEGKARNSNRFSATGYATVFHYLDPRETYSDKFMSRSMDLIVNSKKLFVEGHGSGILHLFGGFLTAALSPAVGRDDVYREVLDYYKYWLNIERCYNGSFYSSPKRDASDFGFDLRYSPTGTVLLFLSGHKRNLEMLGRDRKQEQAKLGSPGTSGVPGGTSSWLALANRMQSSSSAPQTAAEAKGADAKAPETAVTAPGEGTKPPDATPKSAATKVTPDARPVADAQTVAAWDAKLLDRTRALVDAKTRLAFPLSALGVKVTILAASNTALNVRMESGGTIELDWSRLTPEDKRNLALAMAVATDRPEDHALAAFHLLLAGYIEKAEEHLARSEQEADLVREAIGR